MTLHDAIAAAAPIHGVAIVDANDRSTWRIDFEDNATDQQRAAAALALLTYDDLTALKHELRVSIARDAETTRQKFITPGSGKAMDYLEKHNQANAVHDLGQEVANALSESDRRAQFPTLAASVGREAPTLWECAQIVIARYEAWATISYDINTAELDGKIAIRDASDAAAARAAYEAITWPSP